jgi:DNA-directed RNA polymerase specialized sigma24 family protein
MNSAEAVTLWLQRLQAGDPAAAQKLWDHFFARLVRLARRKLHGARRVADEEDVALSAFDSFCRGVGQGRFPHLHERNNLWALLVVITARKAADLTQRERRRKRGGGRVRGESALLAAHGATADEAGMEQLAGPGPTPAFAAQVAEECRRLLDQLGNAELRAIALGKMEGYTNAELAAQLDCALPTVERRLRLIRKIWEKEIAP